MPLAAAPLRPARRGRAVRLALLLALPLGCERLAGPSEYAAVLVTVSDSLGAPVAGVPLTLYTGVRPVEYAATDARGEHLFERVPPLPGGYGVAASVADEFVDVGAAPLLVQDALPIRAGSTERVQFVLRRCAGTLAVAVRDQAGAPAPGVPLTIYGPGIPSVERVTPATGDVEVPGLRCGEYGVALAPAGVYAVDPGRGTSFQDGLRVHRDARLAVAFVVRACSGAIRVTVRDQAGASVAGATLTVYRATGTITTVTSAADGTATVGTLPCGVDLGVSVTPPAGYTVVAGRGTSFQDGLRVSGGTVLDVAFTLTKP